MWTILKTNGKKIPLIHIIVNKYVSSSNINNLIDREIIVFMKFVSKTSHVIVVGNLSKLINNW